MPIDTKLKIQVLVDSKDSWIIPFAKKLVHQLLELGNDTKFKQSHDAIETGDVLFLLGCTKIFKKLELNKHNIVVHESELPKGKGWSPLTWQILEGKNKIPITLFEAVENVDAGSIYLTDKILFEGHELVEELREKQGLKTVELCLKFVKEYKNIKPQNQIGSSTFYNKRTPKDSEIDISKSINEQFNLFRVVDNEKYPAFFRRDGKKYLIKIEKSYEENNN